MIKDPEYALEQAYMSGTLESDLETELEHILEGLNEAPSRPRTAREPSLPVGARPFRVLDRFEFDKSALRPFHPSLIDQVALNIVASGRTGRPVRIIRLV